jgi:hypothetical protein
MRLQREALRVDFWWAAETVSDEEVLEEVMDRSRWTVWCCGGSSSSCSATALLRPKGNSRAAGSCRGDAIIRARVDDESTALEEDWMGG